MSYQNVHAIPLVDIPVVSFSKSLDNNNHVLHSLRMNADRTDGFFMIRQVVSGEFLCNTFPLSGGAPGIMGQWFLAKVTHDGRVYEIEVYERASLEDMKLEPKVYTSWNSSLPMLGIALGDLMVHGIDDLDAYFIASPSDTFCNLGFDVA